MPFFCLGYLDKLVRSSVASGVSNWAEGHVRNMKLKGFGVQCPSFSAGSPSAQQPKAMVHGHLTSKTIPL